MNKKTNLITLIPLQVLALAPLLVYPFVFIASIMGVAGHRTGNEPLISLILAYTFYVLTIVYPIPAIVCSIFAWLNFAKEKSKKSIVFGVVPILLLAVIFLMILTFEQT